ncbi:MAG: hypothetical protein GWP91_21680 [Rhodobacterales bacterium]|nr:hypothetical protein [Rhodobacterales bacterium]
MKRLLALSLVGLTLVGCGYASDRTSWRDQLVADSPCFEVNLLDGLDDSSTAELRNLYDCVNHHGHVVALEPSMVSLEQSVSRSGLPAGVEVATALNAMADLDVDPLALAGVLLDAMRAPDRPVDELLNIGLELITGQRADRVRSGELSTSNLESSVLIPLASVAPIAAGALLDGDLAAAEWAGSVIVHPDTVRWIRTGSAYLESDLPAVSEPLTTALPNLGQALLASQSPANDRWPGASGNSLKDLLRIYLVQDDPVLQDISADAAILLSDSVFRVALEAELVRLHNNRSLQDLGPDLAWLSNVDLRGDGLPPGEPSALHRFLRLLSNTNETMDCSLWIVPIPFTNINLAVEVLEFIADMDPGAVQTTASVISILTDNFFSEFLLDQVAGSGICDTLTNEVMDDLIAVDVLTEPEANNLLTAIVGLLQVSKNNGTNHIPDVANLLQAAHQGGGTEPLEELARDLGNEDFLSDLVDVVPILADPSGHGITLEGDEPVDLAEAIGLIAWAVEIDDTSGNTGLQELRPLLVPILTEDGTWEALDRAGSLLRDEQSQTAHALELLPPLLALDPQLTLLQDLGPLLGERSVSMPLLRAIESPGVVEKLLAATPNQDGQQTVPLAFISGLIADGTLDEILALIDLLITDLSDDA